MNNSTNPATVSDHLVYRKQMGTTVVSVSSKIARTHTALEAWYMLESSEAGITESILRMLLKPAVKLAPLDLVRMWLSYKLSINNSITGL